MPSFVRKVNSFLSEGNVSYLVSREEKEYHWLKNHLRLVGKINKKRREKGQPGIG
jgi:hypothetical protein